MALRSLYKTRGTAEILPLPPRWPLTQHLPTLIHHTGTVRTLIHFISAIDFTLNSHASASTGGRAPTVFSHFIMPRTRRSQPVSASAMPGSGPAPPAGPDPPATLSQDHPQPPKRRTVATNSLAIDSMGAQLYTMSQLLERISDRVGVDSPPVPAPAVPVTQATPAPAPTPPQVHSATCPPGFISRPVTPFQDPQAWLYPPHPSRVRHATEGQMFDSVNNSSFPMSQNPGIPAASTILLTRHTIPGRTHSAQPPPHVHGLTSQQHCRTSRMGVILTLPSPSCSPIRWPHSQRFLVGKFMLVLLLNGDQRRLEQTLWNLLWRNIIPDSLN